MFSMNNFLRRLGGIFSFSISVPAQTILPSKSMLTFNRTVSPAINHNVILLPDFCRQFHGSVWSSLLVAVSSANSRIRAVSSPKCFQRSASSPPQPEAAALIPLGGLKFLCGSQPEIRDGSDQEEARRAGLGMQERADSTSF